MINLNLLNETIDFKRLPNDFHKVKIAISRLENPYKAKIEALLAYQEYLEKDRHKTRKEFIDRNEYLMLPKLIEFRVIKKKDIEGLIDYRRELRRFDCLSYLMNRANELKFHPKSVKLFKKFTPESEVPQHSLLLDETDINVGDILWVGNFPAPWRVLKKVGRKFLLLSEYVLDCRFYRGEVKSDEYRVSGLREWLNGRFYNNFFTDEEKSRIVPVWLDDNDRESFTEFEDSYENNLFILSKKDAEKYFKDSNDRRAPVTLYSVKNATYILFEEYATWWLRTPTEIPVYGHYHVKMTGDISMYGTMYSSTPIIKGWTADQVTMQHVNSDTHGVRPRMYLEIK